MLIAAKQTKIYFPIKISGTPVSSAHGIKRLGVCFVAGFSFGTPFLDACSEIYYEVPHL